MTTVFDLINELREANHMTIRGLGEAAGIKPATFESMMTRRPRSIDLDRLERIAALFGLAWQDLFEDGREVHGLGTAKPKVDTYIKHYEMPAIREKVFRKAMIDAPLPLYVPEPPVPESAPKQSVKLEDTDFRQVIYALIERLNDEGIMEAMRRVIEIERDPKYQKHSNL